MIYMRGQAADYEQWRQAGNTGWGWDDVLPYFLKSEDHYLGATNMHGEGGEWRIKKNGFPGMLLMPFEKQSQK